MKTRRNTTMILALAALALPALAAVPHRWTVETSRIQPEQIEAYRGETIALEATLNAYGKPLEAALESPVCLYWQTNGMGTVYWVTNAAVSAANVLAASFLPSFAPAASAVQGFIGSPSSSYRASFVIRFRNAPGETPNVLPLPAQAIDFNAVTVYNPPYYTKDEVDKKVAGAAWNATNYVDEVTGDLADDVAAAKGKAQNALNGVSSLRKAGYLTTNALFAVEWLDTWRLSTGETVRLYWTWDEENGIGGWTSDTNGVDFLEGTFPAGAYIQESGSAADEGLTTLTRLMLFGANGEDVWQGTAQRESRNGLGLATLDDLAPAAADASAAKAQSDTNKEGIANVTAVVQTWESFLDGSNVVFSITNYLSGAYSTETAKLRILELRGGEYVEVYNSRDEIVKHLTEAKTEIETAVDVAVEGKADKAWGKYTSAGGEAPSNTVYMTAPNTVFAGGMEYQRVAVGEGSVCVLATKGAPVWTQGDEGVFKFQDDGGTNYFGFAKTDSYTVGCDTDGIGVQDGIVTLRYNVTMSGVPVIWYTPSLTAPVAWEQLNLPDGSAVAGASRTVSWEASPDAGTEVCYINCSEPQGYFRATIEVAGSAKFMTNMPADLSGGILCTDGAHKVKVDYNNGSPKFVVVE